MGWSELRDALAAQVTCNECTAATCICSFRFSSFPGLVSLHKSAHYCLQILLVWTDILSSVHVLKSAEISNACCLQTHQMHE